MESIHFRNGTKKDIGVLAELFRETVCRINSRDYSPEQIAAVSYTHLTLPTNSLL